jgi:hypothetical protein
MYALALHVVSFFKVSPPKLCMYFSSSPLTATCLTYLLLLYLITLITFDEEFLIMKLFIMQICSLLLLPPLYVQ